MKAKTILQAINTIALLAIAVFVALIYFNMPYLPTQGEMQALRQNNREEFDNLVDLMPYQRLINTSVVNEVDVRVKDEVEVYGQVSIDRY